MIVYLVRRVGQSLLAVMAMAVLVFLGVFFIGNPVDVLVSPEASQAQIAASRIHSILRTAEGRALAPVPQEGG